MFRANATTSKKKATACVLVSCMCHGNVRLYILTRSAVFKKACGMVHCLVPRVQMCLYMCMCACVRVPQPPAVCGRSVTEAACLTETKPKEVFFVLATFT